MALPMSARTVCERLRKHALHTLRGLIEPGQPCALVDFPAYRNPGDSATWLGERSLLNELGASIVYVCDSRGSYSEAALANRLPQGGTILLSGGGNLGDLWLDRQKLREEVIQTFPKHRIIQLPQSIHFDRSENVNRARAVFDAHPNFMLCLRDRASLSYARQEFRARSVLCPDMAFGIESVPALVDPNFAVVWIRRNDK